MPDMVFLGHHIRMWKSPMVYVLRDESNAAIYVGMSGAGISRPFTSDHHAIRNTNNGHRIEVYYCKTKSEARALESKLIRDLRPTRNRIGIGAEGSQPAGRRHEVGIIETSRGWRAFVRVNGRLLSKCFRPHIAIETVRAWREEAKKGRKRPHKVTNESPYDDMLIVTTLQTTGGAGLR